VSSPLDFNPFDPGVRRNPHPLYARARAEAPVLTHPGLGAHSVFRYADIQDILRDSETWSSDNRRLQPARSSEDQVTPMIGLDPPQHTRLRGLVNKAFTPRIVQRREGHLRELAQGLVRDAVERGTVDIVEALTHPLPMVIIAEILGVPPEDRDSFKRWSETVIAGVGSGLLDAGPTEDEAATREAASREMDDYVRALAEKRRADPREDLISGLVHAEEEGSRLTMPELIAMVTLLLVAGNETTTTLIGNAIVTLLEHPDALARLRAEPALLPAAIDEVMRFTSPVQTDPRRAIREVELHGVTVRPDEMVLCWLASAGRDADVFDEPDRFDIARSPNRHLGFGFGAHYCLGSNLALLEARIALEALLGHTSSFARTDDAELPLHPSFIFYGFTSIPLELKPR
jgi:cytochrome P450